MTVRSALASTTALLIVLTLGGFGDPSLEVDPVGPNFVIDGERAEDGQRYVGPAPANDSSDPRLLYVPICIVGGTSVCSTVRQCNGDGVLHQVLTIEADGTRRPWGQICFGGRELPPAAPPVVTDAMVLRALRRVGVPEPVLVVQPPGGRTLVNLETIFSTRAEPFSASVRIVGRRVDLRVTPRSFLWRHGDGTTQRSSTPGRTYRRGVAMSRYLTHVYTDAGVTVRPRVAVEYGARYRVDGGPWREVVGTVTSQGPAQALRVVEATPVLVTPR